MFSLAVLFILLGAYFVAMVHLIVYAGAVLVLFLFVIMLQGVGATDLPLKDRFHRGYLLPVYFMAPAFLFILSLVIKKSGLQKIVSSFSGTVEVIGQSLFHDFLLPFELTSLLLLLGVFAAVALAKDHQGSETRNSS